MVQQQVGPRETRYCEFVLEGGDDSENVNIESQCVPSKQRVQYILPLSRKSGRLCCCSSSG